MIGDEIRASPALDVLDVELNERDAFAALWTNGCTVRGLDTELVNNVPVAISNAHLYAEEIVARIIRIAGGRQAA